MTRPLVLCATRLETWAVRRRAPGVDVVRVGVGGGNGHTAQVLISAGLAGGLRPEHRTGTVVVATSVTNVRGTPIDCDPDLVDALCEAARRNGFPVVCGPTVTAQRLVTGAARAELAERDFIAVDMESSRAAAPGVHFASVRVILDGPGREISPSWAAPRRVLTDPGAWGDLVWLARHAPRCALRAGTVLGSAVLDVDAEV